MVSLLHHHHVGDILPLRPLVVELGTLHHHHDDEVRLEVQHLHVEALVLCDVSTAQAQLEYGGIREDILLLVWK